MTPDALTDTFLNVTVFAFIAVLIWLYLRDEGDANDDDDV